MMIHLFLCLLLTASCSGFLRTAPLPLAGSWHTLSKGHTPPLFMSEEPFSAQRRQEAKANELNVPPDASKYQTESQRRRSLPLSQLKRRKKKKNEREDLSGQGELRPMVAKTDRRSRLQGEDYWIDNEELEKSRARESEREAAAQRRSTLQEGQFTREKLREEIISPW
ncbi:unnamed protein product [Chrysoparadoxa australica]